MTPAKQIANAVLIAVTIVALSVAIWIGYWALAKKSVANQYDINTNTQQYQAGLISQERDRVTAYDAATDDAQKTVIDVETAQVHGVATTTFFFNMGVQRPIKVCPSIGFPVASTAQLTNPTQIVTTNNGVGNVDQAEPNGVYTGASSGTYVVCVAANGTKYVTYWEGDVQTEGGPAHWDDAKGQIVLDGAPTVVSKSQK